MSEDSEFSGDDDEEDESRSGQGNFGGFTSTVCVNFSQDDLRLATIPGQEGVSTVTVTLSQSHCHNHSHTALSQSHCSHECHSVSLSITAMSVQNSRSCQVPDT